jgi:hypothetical protein
MNLDKKTILFSALVIILIATNLATYVWLRSGAGQKAPQQPDQIGEPAPATTTTTVATSTATTTAATTSPAADQLSVTWNAWPAKVEPRGDVFNIDSFDKECKKITSSFDSKKDICDFVYTSFKAYSIGTVEQGKYAGAELFLVAETPEGPAFRDNYYRILRLKGQLIYLAKQSESIEYNDLVKAQVKIDKDAFISNLEPPQEIAIPNSTYKLKRAVGYFNAYLLTEFKNPKKVFEYELGKWVYLDEKLGCYLVGAADGTVRHYDFALPFAKDVATSTESAGNWNGEQTYRFQWAGTTSISEEFYNIRPVGGCGANGCLDYASFIVPDGLVAKSLIKAGTTEQGELLYEFSDLEIKLKIVNRYDGSITEQTAKKYLEEIYNQYFPGWDDKGEKQKAKMPFADFAKKHPLVFWRDPFGQYVQLSRTEFAPAVECGKPVIYLYPQETTTVSVQVKPNGGISKSEPAYGNGWQVEARPDGRLKNLADQKAYPYLFWEGEGISYQSPSEGFVVARSEVGSFLHDKLAKLGLNEKEAADFQEFWLPRMQKDNYYLISFLPQPEFERLAPLAISPRPDTVIRVFMDYQGLDRPIKVKEQLIKTPVRRGFAVVEWGGAIR